MMGRVLRRVYILYADSDGGVSGFITELECVCTNIFIVFFFFFKGLSHRHRTGSDVIDPKLSRVKDNRSSCFTLSRVGVILLRR
jgi:hypothetical protein